MRLKFKGSCLKQQDTAPCIQTMLKTYVLSLN